MTLLPPSLHTVTARCTIDPIVHQILEHILTSLAACMLPGPPWVPPCGLSRPQLNRCPAGWWPSWWRASAAPRRHQSGRTTAPAGLGEGDHASRQLLYETIMETTGCKSSSCSPPRPRGPHTVFSFSALSSGSWARLQPSCSVTNDSGAAGSIGRNNALSCWEQRWARAKGQGMLCMLQGSRALR